MDRVDILNAQKSCGHVFLTPLSPDLLILSCFGIDASIRQHNIKRKKPHKTTLAFFHSKA